MYNTMNINALYIPGSIASFLKKYPELSHMGIARVLYVQEHNFEIYVVQCDGAANHNAFIFQYECGLLAEMRSENDTFDQYFALIPSAHASEYIKF